MASINHMKVLNDSVRPLQPYIFFSLGCAAFFAPMVYLGYLRILAAGFLRATVAGIVSSFSCFAVAYYTQRRRELERKERSFEVDHAGRLMRPVVDEFFKNQKMKTPAWISMTEWQKVEWLNKVLKELWPMLNKATSAMIRDILTPMLDSYKMGLITEISVRKFTLGNIGPRVTGIRTFKEAKGGGLNIEIDVDWTRGKDQAIVLQVNTLIVPMLKIKVSNIKFKAVFQLIMKPLINELPGFGAILFSFRDQPLIEFDIGVLGGDVMKLPGILAMIDNIIKTSLADMLVWPSRIVIPIVPGDYSALEFKPSGYVKIVLIDGSNLPKVDTLGKIDPFVIFFVRQKKEKMRRSSVKKLDMSPVWQEEFNLEVEAPDYQELTIRLMDWDMIGMAELVGSCKYPLSKLEPNTPTEEYVNLLVDPEKPKQGPSRGTLHLLLTYHPYASAEEAEKSPAKQEDKVAANLSASSMLGNGMKVGASTLLSGGAATINTFGKGATLMAGGASTGVNFVAGGAVSGVEFVAGGAASGLNLVAGGAASAGNFVTGGVGSVANFMTGKGGKGASEAKESVEKPTKENSGKGMNPVSGLLKGGAAMGNMLTGGKKKDKSVSSKDFKASSSAIPSDMDDGQETAVTANASEGGRTPPGSGELAARQADAFDEHPPSVEINPSMASPSPSPSAAPAKSPKSPSKGMGRSFLSLVGQHRKRESRDSMGSVESTGHSENMERGSDPLGDGDTFDASHPPKSPTGPTLNAFAKSKSHSLRDMMKRKPRESSLANPANHSASGSGSGATSAS